MSVLHLVKTLWKSFHLVPNIASVLLFNITASVFLCTAYPFTHIHLSLPNECIHSFPFLHSKWLRLS